MDPEQSELMKTEGHIDARPATFTYNRGEQPEDRQLIWAESESTKINVEKKVGALRRLTYL